MYAWIWRHLPGPWPVRVIVALALVLAVVTVLFLWVFPWAEPRLPFDDVTVDGQPASSLPAGGRWPLSPTVAG